MFSAGCPSFFKVAQLPAPAPIERRRISWVYIGQEPLLTRAGRSASSRAASRSAIGALLGHVSNHGHDLIVAQAANGLQNLLA